MANFTEAWSYSYRQWDWKSAFGLAAYSRSVSFNWSVPLSVRGVKYQESQQSTTIICQETCSNVDLTFDLVHVKNGII